MTETEVKKEIADYLEVSGWKVYRMQAGRVKNNFHTNVKGTPDLMAVSRAGGVIWIEVKKPGGKRSPEQAIQHHELKKRKQAVFTVQSALELDQKIRCSGVAV